VPGTGRPWVRLVVSSCRTTTAWPQYSLNLIEIAAAVCRTRVTLQHHSNGGTSPMVNSSSAEFSLALRKLELRTRLKKSERYALAEFLDFNKDGTIDYEVRCAKNVPILFSFFLSCRSLCEASRWLTRLVTRTGKEESYSAWHLPSSTTASPCSQPSVFWIKITQAPWR